MELTRRDLFKQSLGLVGILSGLSSNSVNLPTFPLNAYYLNGYRYAKYSLFREMKEGDVIIGLTVRGYPESVARDLVGHSSYLIRNGFVKLKSDSILNRMLNIEH